jgi:O-Antigen ligase
MNHPFVVLWVVVVGLAFGVFPEAAVVLLVVAGLLHVVGNRRWQDKTIEILFALWMVVRMVLSSRVNGEPWFGMLEILVVWLVFRGLNYLRGQMVVFSRAACLGLCIAVSAALIQAWSLVDTRLNWVAVQGISRSERLAFGYAFTALDKGNAWLFMTGTAQGPGKVRFEFDVRAKKSITIGMFTNEWRSSADRPQTVRGKCVVGTAWQTCQLELDLSKRSIVTVGLGGSETWKAGDPALEIGLPRVQVLTSPTLWQRVSIATRSSGWAFNENAFGAWVALVALVIFASCSGGVVAVGMVFGALGVFLSGSRGAFFALVAGLLIMVIYRYYRYTSKLKIIVGITFFISGITFLSVFNNKSKDYSSFRAVSVFISTDSRQEIYRVATSLFVHSPIFGIGDANTAIGNLIHKNEIFDSFSPVHSHNLLLQVVTESGFFGLIITFLIFFVAFYRSFKSQNWYELAIVFVILVINSSDYLFFYSAVKISFCIVISRLIRSNRFELRFPND